MKRQRPYIILKWAQTADGFIAKENYDSKWISNEHSRQLVHKWRSEEDAVLVGTKTVFHDNPKLSVREWTGRNPTRFVIDRFLKLSTALHVFDRSQRTLVYNVLKHEEHGGLTLARVDDHHFMNELIADLNKRKIQSVLVEGGAQTLQHFFDTGLWDEARVFTSRHTFGRGIRSPQFHGNLISSEPVLTDTLSVYHSLYGKS